MRCTVKGFRRVLGDEHPTTIQIIANLGLLLSEQHKYSEAEPYLREALEKRRRILGEDHPATWESIAGVGTVLWSQGKLSEAEPYYLESLDRRRHVLGDEHRATLLSISNMGLLLRSQGRLAEAETYSRQALKGLRRVLGDDHHMTIYRILNLGSVLRDQGQLSEAEELFAEGLRRARAALLGDSLIGSFLRNHARTLARMERFEQAEAELVEVQEIYAAAQGPAGADTVATIRSFAEIYGAWHAAEPNQGYDAKAAEWRAKLPAHLRAISLIKFGKKLLGAGRHAEAEAALSECLQIRQEVLPEGHWLIFNTMSTLGESLAGQGMDPALAAAARIEKLREAEALLLEGYEGMKDHPEALDVRKREALKRLVKLYEAWHAAEPDQGYDAKAAAWRAKLPSTQSESVDAPATSQPAALPTPSGTP